MRGPRGVETPHKAVFADRNSISSVFMAGEAAAHVQSFGLKAVAVVLVRLSNSPAARG